MKIRTVKKMRLDELLKNVWDGNLPAKTYASDRFTEIVNVKENGVDFRELKFGDIHKNTIYAVEVEEELTEDTGISGATFIYYYAPSEEVRAYSYSEYARPTINQIIKSQYENKALAIYRGMTLIWSKDTGIPESGVLEVGAE